MVLKLNAMRQGFVYRTTLGDLGETFSLCFVEITLDVNIAGNLFNESSIGNIAILAVVRMDT